MADNETTITPADVKALLTEFVSRERQTYVGMRYVPKFADPIAWDSDTEYEPLTMVTYNDAIYVSKFYVPSDVDISETEYWAPWGAFADGTIDFDTLTDELRSAYVRTFDTVSDMQAATDLIAGMTCHTNGFHSVGDGGAAYYTISASGTANGMDVLALQDDMLATLVVTEPYVTPEQFGAWGDDTHDDTAAVQHACESEYSVTFDGAKTYLLASAVSISEGDFIDFNDCTLHCTGTTGLSITMPGGTQPHNMAPVHIANLNIKGNGANILIYWENVLRSTIESVRFYDFAVGFDFVSGYETYGNDLRFIGSNSTCIGMRSSGGDSFFHNLMMRDCHTGLNIKSGSNKYYNFHAWMRNPDYYEDSVMVLDESAGGTRQQFFNPYFDTYHYCYKRTGLSTVLLSQPTLINNYTVTDAAGITTAYFLHLTYADADKPYANRIYVDRLITQLTPNTQIYEICNKTDLAFQLTYVAATSATVAKINALAVFDIYDVVSGLSDSTAITDITSNFITLNSGFTLGSSSKVYKQGKHVFGNILINCSDGFSSSGATDTVGAITSAYRPASAVNTGCFFSSSEWAVSGVGYLYMLQNLAVKTTDSGMTYAKIAIDYVTA